MAANIPRRQRPGREAVVLEYVGIGLALGLLVAIATWCGPGGVLS